MQQTLRVWGKKLAATSNDQPAYLLETMGASNREPHTSRVRLKNRR